MRSLCESKCAISNKITLPSSSRNSLGLRHPRDAGGGKREHWTDDAIAIGRAGYKSIPAARNARGDSYHCHGMYDWKGSVFCGDVFLPFMGPIEEEEWRDGTTQNVRGNFPGGDPRGRPHPDATYSHIIYASLLRDASKDEREVA